MSSHRRSPSPYQTTRRPQSPDFDSNRRKRGGKSDRRRGEYSDDEREIKHLPNDAKALTEEDYYLKNAEFRAWLKEVKDHYFDALSGEKARSYFRKFVKAWNRGKLPKQYYAGEDFAQRSASSQTSYKWSFASKHTRAEQDAIDAARREVGAATRAGDPGAISLSDPTGTSIDNKRRSGKTIGPTMPSSTDFTLLRETTAESRALEASLTKKRARAEEKERIEDLVGPREVGREGMLEKKRLRREEGRSAQAAKDDAFGDYDDGTLMGGGDSFQARLAQRDAARRRFEEKRNATKEDKTSAFRERQEAMREKDRATMEMFKQMAKERFG